MEVADQQASSATTTSIEDFDGNSFQQFMIKNPVWDFHCISRDEYLRKSKAEKEQLVLQYYNKMEMRELLHFLFIAIVF